MGFGANIFVLKIFFYPSTHVREKYNNIQQGDKLGGCLITGKCTKIVSRTAQVVITFRHDDFKNIVLYAVAGALKRRVLQG